MATTSGVASRVPTLLVWIRQELRIHDNPILWFQSKIEPFQKVIPVFVFDPRQFGSTHDFGLSRCSLHRARFLLESVDDFKSRLQALGSDLVIRSGLPAEELKRIAESYGATDAVWAYHVGTEEENDSRDVKIALQSCGIKVHPEIWDSTLVNMFDLPFQDVRKDLPLSYTPFRKIVEKGGLKVRKLVPMREKLEPLPQNIECGTVPTIESLIPNTDDGWALKLGPDFRIRVTKSFDSSKPGRFKGGETAALDRWQYWAWEKDRLRTYKATRNGLVGDLYSSQLSPYLALGLISPRFIFTEIRRYEETFQLQGNENTYWLVFELLWRDYFKFLALKLKSSLFKLHGSGETYVNRAWLQDSNLFRKWALGETGYPFVDAAMNELRLTGFMSNRARQVVASFLTKDMGLDWRIGAEWFESQLLDHDVASNYGNWQYNAGVGVDPREDRYFNLDKQTKVYDPDGQFRKLWRTPGEHAPCLDRLGAFTAGGPRSIEASPQRKKQNNTPRKNMTERGAARDIRGFFTPPSTSKVIENHKGDKAEETVH